MQITMSTSSNPLESDDFWAWFGEFGFSAELWELAPGEVDKVLSLTQPPREASVLDLACGPGRHSIELARRGYQVTGIDRTSPYIEEARRRAVESAVDAEFVVADMRSFVRPEAFDLAINLFSSFGYFEDEEDHRRVIRNVHASLRPGGRLIVEIVGREPIAMRFRPEGVTRYPDGTVIVEERRIVDGWRYIDSTWTRISDGVVSTYNIRMRLYGAFDLTALLQDCGFNEVDVFGSLDGTPYDLTARRLIAVARK